MVQTSLWLQTAQLWGCWQVTQASLREACAKLFPWAPWKSWQSKEEMPEQVKVLALDGV